MLVLSVAERHEEREMRRMIADVRRQRRVGCRGGKSVVSARDTSLPVSAVCVRFGRARIPESILFSVLNAARRPSFPLFELLLHKIR